MLGVYGGEGFASPLCSKVALADSVEDPLEAQPLCSKAALADSVEDPLEASPLCSKAALADSVEDPPEASPLCSKGALADLVNFHLAPLQLQSLKLLHFPAHLRM